MIDFDGEAVFRLNNRNSMNLVYEGYSFHKHRKTKDGADYWVCVKRNDKQLKCSARVYSMRIGKKYMIKVINASHSHGPDLKDDD